VTKGVADVSIPVYCHVEVKGFEIVRYGTLAYYTSPLVLLYDGVPEYETHHNVGCMMTSGKPQLAYLTFSGLIAFNFSKILFFLT
jgi:hypothetical protein